MKTAKDFAKRFASEHYNRKEQNALWWACFIGFRYGFKKCKRLYHYDKSAINFKNRKS